MLAALLEISAHALQSEVRRGTGTLVGTVLLVSLSPRGLGCSPVSMSLAESLHLNGDSHAYKYGEKQEMRFFAPPTISSV